MGLEGEVTFREVTMSRGLRSTQLRRGDGHAGLKSIESEIVISIAEHWTWIDRIRTPLRDFLGEVTSNSGSFKSIVDIVAWANNQD